MIALAVLSLLVAAAAAALLAREWFVDRWSSYAGGARVALSEAEHTSETVRWLQLLGNPPGGSVPCMAAQPSSTPFICGRNNGHAGHHIAFGVGHRILVTWAADVAGIPEQRRAVD